MSKEKNWLVCEGDGRKGEIVYASSAQDAAEYYFTHTDPVLPEVAVYDMAQLPEIFERNVKVRRSRVKR